MAPLVPTRAFVKDVKRIVVKGLLLCLGIEGRIAVGRVGSLCEQLKELNSRGLEVILVTSGAVGIGRQRLKYRILVNSSFADLQKPPIELDGKACAAVGQSGLMALYDALFSQLDVTSSQLLVTDDDFKDPEFREQLSKTVNQLLQCKDSSGIFWDNDSLAALLALELKADLLVLLSDVEGLYSGPPGEPQSKIINTYIKERHQDEITFGDKSRVGRGGMTAKVKSALYAASAGTPVIITSGFATDSTIKVLQGQRVGMLFHKDATLWTLPKEIGAREMAVAARECSRRLQSMSSEDRRKILLDIANALEANEKLIKIENEADVAAARQAGYEKSLISRLSLKLGKISSLANSIRVLANMEDPMGQVLARTELADGLILEKTSSPLGVLLIVFESRPDALVQIASLAIQSGNGLLLKGGKEAVRSNAILHKIIVGAIPDNVGEKLIGLVTSRNEIPDLLKLDDVIDLVIPRGSNKLVSQIKESTKIPVLGHADGICHVYVDKSANMDTTKRIVLDAKIDYPASCNDMETLLVHKDLIKTTGLDDIIMELRSGGVALYGGPRATVELDIPLTCSFRHEYNSLACTIEIVDSVLAAIDHIHCHGSAHTDCIITEDREIAETFLKHVDRNTLGEIAGEKAGIFKQGIPAYTVPQPEEAMAVLKNKASQLGIPLQVVLSLDRQQLKHQQLGLHGEHQYLNAGLATALARTWLQRTGHAERIILNNTNSLPEQFVRGLTMADLAGRAQIVPDPYICSQNTTFGVGGLVFYLDGAHSPESLEVCARWFSHVIREEIQSNQEPDGSCKSTQILLFDCMSVRDPQLLLPPLANICSRHGIYFDKALFVPNQSVYNKVGSHLATQNDPQQVDLSWQLTLQRVWENLGHGDKGRGNDKILDPPEGKKHEELNTTKGDERSSVFASLPLAIKWLRENAQQNRSIRFQVLVTGSLHLVGDVLRLIKK